jgi:hypothetical protein
VRIFVIVEIEKVSDTFFNILNAFSSPIPVKLSTLKPLAFLKEPLNTSGI